MNKLLDKMTADKELLSTMPKNNKKNIEKYLNTLDKMRKEYTKSQSEIFEILNKRYLEITKIKPSNEIEHLERQVLEMREFLDIFNKAKTSYEKMGIDRKIYKLSKFYKENLEAVNIEISRCIDEFRDVGINLNPSDFDYSIYVKDYMNTFFEEKEEGNVNSNNIKNKFGDIYWKCPEIIIQIELNLRHLYIKNKKEIDKFYKTKRESVLKSTRYTPRQLLDKYYNLRLELGKHVSVDKEHIISEFKVGKIQVKNFTNENVKSCYEKIVFKPVLDNASVTEFKEINENIYRFIQSLYEYKNYLKFKYIIDDVKEKYNQRNEQKKAYDTTLKEISSIEKKLQGLNKKLTGRSIFGTSKIEKQNAEYNQIILELEEKYKKLAEDKIYHQLDNVMKDNSTIYEAMCFASGYETYMIDLIKKQNPDITLDDADKVIDEFEQFLMNPNNTMIGNILLQEEKNMPVIIADRYRLLNFNVKKEDIEENIDSLIDTLNTIRINNNIQQSGIKIEDLDFIVQFEKLKEKKDNGKN